MLRRNHAFAYLLSAAVFSVACTPKTQRSSRDTSKAGPIGGFPVSSAALAAAAGPDAPIVPAGPPLTTHPRLFVRQSDLARLRAWAVPTNPMFGSGIDMLAREWAKRMDAGDAPLKDPGGPEYTSFPTESYAELFAFMSLVSPSEADRAAYAKRAHTLLMFAIDHAAAGPSDKPFARKSFSVSDRSRWHGEGFGLTVDWIYDTFSADEKAKIRKVFLRWADELTHAQTTDHNHPEPIGVTNDAALTSDRLNVRWSANNYFNAHARNLGLMAMSFDAADDPDEKLRSYLKSVTGAWLYMTDRMLRTDMTGGLSPEGFEYAPQAIGYIAQLLAALHTSGQADPKLNGVQATFAAPFWGALIPAYLHSLSPQASVAKNTEFAYLGPLYSIAAFADDDKTWCGDPIAMLGALGLYDGLGGDEKRLAQIRWIVANTPPGGASTLTTRVGKSETSLGPILAFLLFDPKAAAPADPRPSMPLTHFAPGLGRFLSRTSWNADATWFTFKLSYEVVDHQHGDGNMFELYRKGEWLTKERSGYGSEIGSSDYHNTLALQNDAPFHNEGYRGNNYARGSQWMLVNSGDPKLTTSINDKFFYSLGDATPLYNSAYEKVTDIVHASRSLVWLKPERIVTYDRAESKTDKRWKRFWLNLPSAGTVEKDLTTARTPGGQKLFVRTLLPSSAAITVEPVESMSGAAAKLDPITHRLRVEIPNGPKTVRFLHVLQGADANAAGDKATLVRSASGTPYEGAAFNDVVVLFPVDLGGTFASVSYSASASTKAHLVTGLTPDVGYKVTTQTSGDSMTVTVSTGGDAKADAGGVLVIGALP